MSEKIFADPLDNSKDVPIEDSRSNFLGSNTGTIQELQEKNIYLKNLQLQIQMTRDLYGGNEKGEGKTEGWQAGTIAIADEMDPTKINFVPAGKLLLKEDKFQALQKKIIIFLNTVGPSDPVYKQMAEDIGTSDIWQLSTHIANHIMQRDRAESLYNVFRGSDKPDSVPYYEQLISGTESQRDEAKKKLAGVRKPALRSF